MLTTLSNRQTLESILKNSPGNSHDFIEKFLINAKTFILARIFVIPSPMNLDGMKRLWGRKVSNQFVEILKSKCIKHKRTSAMDFRSRSLIGRT